MFGMSAPPPAPAKKKAPAKKVALVTVSVKLTAAQRKKLTALGGSAWVQEAIDSAKVPATPFGV